jgi:hypothetical protein
VFQVGFACYPSEASAAIAAATQAAGAVVQHGSAAYVVEVGAAAATSITYVFHPVAGGTPVTMVTPYSAQPCQLLTMADGFQLGWMVAGCWIAVFCVIQIKHALFGAEVATNGNP